MLAEALHTDDTLPGLHRADVADLQVEGRVPDPGLEGARHAEAHRGVEEGGEHTAVDAAHRVGVELLRLEGDLGETLAGIGDGETERAGGGVVRDRPVHQPRRKSSPCMSRLAADVGAGSSHV